MKVVWKISFGTFLLLAITVYEARPSGNPAFRQSHQVGDGDDFSSPLLPVHGNVSGTAPSSEVPVDESEDEDETSKEKMYYHPASIHSSLLVKQRYLLQQSMFRQLSLEIETPPPRH